MDNNELENVEQDNEGLDAGQIGFWAGIIGGAFGLVMGIKAWRSSRALKKEREKNALFQDMILKHQAEIDALKNAKEREEYKNQLWEELKSRTGEC